MRVAPAFQVSMLTMLIGREDRVIRRTLDHQFQVRFTLSQALLRELPIRDVKKGQDDAVDSILGGAIRHGVHQEPVTAPRDDLAFDSLQAIEYALDVRPEIDVHEIAADVQTEAGPDRTGSA